MALTAQQIIRQLFDYLGYKSAEAFATDIGYSRGDVVSELLYDRKGKGKGYVSVNLTDKITAKFPRISRHWLLSGEGDMLVSGEDDPMRDVLTGAAAEAFFGTQDVIWTGRHYIVSRRFMQMLMRRTREVDELVGEIERELGIDSEEKLPRRQSSAGVDDGGVMTSEGVGPWTDERGELVRDAEGRLIVDPPVRKLR